MNVNGHKAGLYTLSLDVVLHHECSLEPTFIKASCELPSTDLGQFVISSGILFEARRPYNKSFPLATHSLCHFSERKEWVHFTFRLFIITFTNFESTIFHYLSFRFAARLSGCLPNFSLCQRGQPIPALLRTTCWSFCASGDGWAKLYSPLFLFIHSFTFVCIYSLSFTASM